ncbi:MAG: oxidase [Chloroflexi bacterium]|nr:oxidase [Chloroflexota bacterium]
MIPNQWYIVLSSKQVRDKPVGVTRLGQKLVFWRDLSGKIACLQDWCIHRGVALSKGKIVQDRLKCPFHGFEFDPTGRVCIIPANGKSAPVPKAFQAQSYLTYEAHDFIWIWWGQNPPADLQPPRFFNDIDDQLSYAEKLDPWNAHYSRVIENQLDAVHIPFIHYNTIGRGNKTLVDGPGVEWLDADMFYLYTNNRVDDGSKPLKPSEFQPKSEPTQKLEFIFPNLWQNYITDQLRVVVAFVPVDANHTIMYLRSYQKFMTVPLLRSLVNALLMPFNVYVAHQDRVVVETQEPKASAWRMDEQLIRGDHPIIEYRRRRAELLGEIS